MYPEFVIGFDAREMWLDVTSLWPSEKKEQILLKHEVTKPLSVDKYVWYSIFTEGSIPRLWQGVSRKPEYLTAKYASVFTEDRMVSNPGWDSMRGIPCLDLNQMEAYLTEQWADVWKPCWMIAMTDVAVNEDEEFEDDIYPIIPAEIDESWVCLGYDVADADLYTGLSDGGLTENAAQDLRSRWQDNLNQYHLFDDPQTAAEYIDTANERVPSHAPFYVYGLYLVKDMAG